MKELKEALKTVNKMCGYDSTLTISHAERIWTHTEAKGYSEIINGQADKVEDLQKRIKKRQMAKFLEELADQFKADKDDYGMDTKELDMVVKMLEMRLLALTGQIIPRYRKNKEKDYLKRAEDWVVFLSKYKAKLEGVKNGADKVHGSK